MQSEAKTQKKNLIKKSYIEYIADMKMQHTIYGSSNIKHMWLLYRLEICFGNMYLKKYSLYVALLTKATIMLS